MKILFVNPYFPPWAPGGAEHSLEQMCLHLSQEGHNIQIIATAFDERSLDEQRNGYWVRWVRAPFDNKHGQDIDAEKYIRTKHFIESVKKRFQRIEHPDVIVANNAQVYGLTEILGGLSKVSTIGIVRDTQLLCEFGACMDNQPAVKASPCLGFSGAGACSIHFQRARGVVGWRPLPAWFWSGIRMHRRRLKLRSALRKFDHIVTISDALNHLVRRSVPIFENISTIRNFTTTAKPVDKQELKKYLENHDLRSKKYFLFAGRKTYGKGADILVQATHIARTEIPNFKTLLLGRGAIPEKVTDGCVDIDSVPQDYLLGLLAEAAALVIPGRWQEGLHRTMIDAIYAGVPVICTDVGAPPIDGVTDGCNGYIVPSNDSRALASAMIRISGWTTEDHERCRITSTERFRSHFATNKLVAQWVDLFQHVSKHKYPLTHIID